MNLDDLPLGAFADFQAFSVNEDCGEIARQLERKLAPLAVVRDASKAKLEEQFLAFRVEDLILEELKKRHGIALIKALGQLPSIKKVGGCSYDPLGTIIRVSTPSTTAVHVLCDHTGTPRALAGGVPPATPPAGEHSATVYPHVEAPHETRPEELCTFRVAVLPFPPAGSTVPLDVVFPEGAQRILVHAEVSSSELARPPGEAWSVELSIDRSLECTPDRWVFTARAHGDRPRYALTIRFFAAGRPLGAISVVVARAGVPDGGGRIGDRPLVLPRDRGPRDCLSVLHEGTAVRFRLYRDDAVAADAVIPALDGDSYFRLLADAASSEDVRGVAYGLCADVPAAVRDELAKGFGPLLIASATPFAPLEVLRLTPDDPGSYLGLRRPVVRWTSDEGLPGPDGPGAAGAACIRPDYAQSPLPEAVDEERLLETRYGAALAHVKTKGELAALLDRADIGLVHFAGHGDGNPARLALGDGDVPPTAFDFARPLFNARPFFFLNGCRVGFAQLGPPAAYANFVKCLLVRDRARPEKGACGVLAPTIRIQSGTARDVALRFYEAALTRTAAEALRHVREMALADFDETRKAAAFSYVLYAHPELRLGP